MSKQKRLIDANECPCLKCETKDYDCYTGNCEDFTRWRLSPVDAAEVVHGEWEITEDDYLSLVELKCSVCGEAYGFEYFEDVTPQSYRYCPNCGARMDGDPQ